MTFETFNKIVKRRLQACRDLLVPKGEEYSRDGDRLYAFKRAAEILRCTPHKALLGMYLKHLVSVIDMVEDYEKEGVLPTDKVLTEKMDDSINYHLLLEGLFREQMGVSSKGDTVHVHITNKSLEEYFAGSHCAEVETAAKAEEAYGGAKGCGDVGADELESGAPGVDSGSAPRG